MTRDQMQQKNSDLSKAQTVPVAKLFPNYQKDITATEAQRNEMAKSFSLEKVDLFKCRFVVKGFERDKIFISGHLKAHFPQYCVSSGALIHQVVESDFDLILVPEEKASHQNGMMTEEDCDEKDIFYYSGEILPLYDIALEQFALEIPPYPRAENAQPVVMSYGRESHAETEKVSPFAVLKKMSLKSE